MTRAFIVRPFGTQEDINFDQVQLALIDPALAANDIQGGTTGLFMQAGNIRADMFQQLLVADIVIADVSIHNANVFYELGIRHALQPNRTFMLRAKSKKDPKDRGRTDEIPFDLKTDRFLEYNSAKPEDTLEALKSALKQTLASSDPDSPVFRMLPDLEAQDRSRFLPVPETFRDDVELAFKAKRLGVLGLIAMEAKDFFWGSEGLRLVGRAQFNLKAYKDAKQTWEELLRSNPVEVESNQILGTIYQRLGDLDASDQALQRVLANKRAKDSERAEALSLIARNIKDRWRSSWVGLDPAHAGPKALASAELLKAYEKYRQGFREDLNSYYPGLNALSLLTITTELARQYPDSWEDRFDTPAQATAELDALQLQRQALIGSVSQALDAKKQRLVRSGMEDRWFDISAADFLFLTSNRPGKVVFAYSAALADAPAFYFDSARSQLDLFRSLGVLPDNTREAFKVFDPVSPSSQPPTAPPSRVILFTGHMIDKEGTSPQRFPQSLTPKAKEAIQSAVERERSRTDGTVVTIASGASGGDLLFHEVCRELNIEHRALLPLPPDQFRNESVCPAGREWEDRFDSLLKENASPPVLAVSEDLPKWLTTKINYTAWQRANLWLIHEALAVGAKNFTLISLWDGVKTDGVGGTYHMRTVAAKCGASLVPVYIADLLKS